MRKHEMKTKERTQGTELQTKPDLKKFLDEVSQKIVSYRGYFELYQPIWECLSLHPRKVILITGETGVGKELVAKTIHDHSDRKDKPFKAINCGAIPEDLVESELFGCEKGAFTGAVGRREGLFKTANHGTIFLDEIAELKPSTQVKLLRVLEERSFMRLGGSSDIKVDVRVIAATNKNLSSEVDAGNFRPDLYYRVRQFPIHVEPLRANPLDIPVLVRFFIEELNKETGKKITSLDLELLLFCISYTWPGNVRDLKDFIEFCHTKCKQGKVISLSDGEALFKDESWKIMLFGIVMSGMRQSDGKDLRDLRYFGLKRIADLSKEENVHQEIDLVDIPEHGKYISEILKWRDAPKGGYQPPVEQKLKRGELPTNDEKKYLEWMKAPHYKVWKKRRIEKLNYERFVIVFDYLFQKRGEVLLSTTAAELGAKDKKTDFLNLPYELAMSQFEKEYLEFHLERNDGNQRKTAEEIAITPQRLQGRLRKFNL